MTEIRGFASRAIHHGYDPLDHDGALTPPLHLTSTFAFESAEAGGQIFAGARDGYFYSRVSNPTTDLLERRIAVLEGGRGRSRPGLGDGRDHVDAVDPGRTGRRRSSSTRRCTAAPSRSCATAWPSSVSRSAMSI